MSLPILGARVRRGTASQPYIPRRAPSLKTLQNWFSSVEDENLANIRKLIRGETHPAKVSALYRARREQGRLYPGAIGRLVAIDDLLGHHGVEVIKDRDGRVIAEYSNSGDTYAATILYRFDSGNFQLTTVGAFVEAWERRHGDLP